MSRKRDLKKKELFISEAKLKKAMDEVAAMSMSDNAFFVNAMKDTELFSHILTLIMGEKMVVIGKIKEVYTEYSITNPGSKGVRLDAVARDSNGNFCHIEMENNLSEASIKRARFYRAVADSRALRKGQPYSELARGITIFLVAGDPFGLGEVKYSFEYYDSKLGFSPDAGSHIIFVNVDADAKGALGALLRDLKEPDYRKINDIILRRVVSYVKGSSDIVVQVYETKIRLSKEREREISEQSFARGVAKGETIGLKKGEAIGLEKGEAIGRSLALKEIILNGYRQGISIERLASIAGLPSEEIVEIIKKEN